MTKRRMIASAVAVAALLLGGTGAVAAAQTFGEPATNGPAVAPADQPDQPGITQEPEPEDGPVDTNEGPGE